MDQLIPTSKDEQGNILVSGRDLHEFLGIKARYNDWFDRMRNYGFEENIDYVAITQKRVTAQGNSSVFINHAMSLDMAKEISMIQRNDKGKQARQYFIQVEKNYKSNESIDYATKNVGGYQVPANYRGALLLAADLQEQVEVMKPKVTYYDKIMSSNKLMTITTISKDYGMSASEFNKMLHSLNIQYKQSGTWYLYSKYQDLGWTSSATHLVKNGDGTSTPRINTKWTQRGRVGLYNLLKKKDIVPSIEKLSDMTVTIGGAK